MVLVNKFFCISLRSTTQIIGWLDVIGSFLYLLSLVVAWLIVFGAIDKHSHTYEWTSDDKGISYYYIYSIKAIASLNMKC